MKHWIIAIALGLNGLAASVVRAEDLAKVGSDPISREEFEQKAALQEAGLKRKLTKDERVLLLRAIVNQRLLVSEAKRQKLDRSPEHKTLMAETERKALSDRIFEAEVGSKAAVTLEEAKQFYKQNPGAFDLAQVSQILVAVKAGQEALAEKKAMELKASLAKAPKTFASVAKAQSDDDLSKPRGGDLGTLRRGMLLPEMEQAVFGAKAGTVIGPVRTQYGYHILYLRSLKRLSWDEAGSNLQQELQRLKTLQLQQALLDQLGKKDKVTLREDKL